MIPVAIWFASRLSRIPSRTWYWVGYHRRPWQWAVLLGGPPVVGRGWSWCSSGRSRPFAPSSSPSWTPSVRSTTPPTELPGRARGQATAGSRSVTSMKMHSCGQSSIASSTCSTRDSRRPAPRPAAPPRCGRRPGRRGPARRRSGHGRHRCRRRCRDPDRSRRCTRANLLGRVPVSSARPPGRLHARPHLGKALTIPGRAALTPTG